MLLGFKDFVEVEVLTLIEIKSEFRLSFSYLHMFDLIWFVLGNLEIGYILLDFDEFLVRLFVWVWVRST